MLAGLCGSKPSSRKVVARLAVRLWSQKPSETSSRVGRQAGPRAAPRNLRYAADERAATCAASACMLAASSVNTRSGLSKAISWFAMSSASTPIAAPSRSAIIFALARRCSFISAMRKQPMPS